METLRIVNTGYEFVFKEYIFSELNKCHYSHLLFSGNHSYFVRNIALIGGKGGRPTAKRFLSSDLTSDF